MDSRSTARILWALLSLDAALTVIAFAYPGIWYQLFHGAPAPADLLYFRRAGAQWAGFALVQAIALARFRQDARWLAAVAGVRLCDVLTDWTALALMHERTPFAWVALIATGPGNALVAWVLFGRARERAACATGAGGAYPEAEGATHPRPETP